ncbi:MAG: cysteine synthase [Solibacillus sp.]
MNKWLIKMEHNGVKVETVIEKTDILEGETLTGSLYINFVEEEMIDVISLQVYRASSTGHVLIDKHSVEPIGNIHSKDTEIISFELIPDERWVCQPDERLVFKTLVQFLDGSECDDEGIISYEPASYT